MSTPAQLPFTFSKPEPVGWVGEKRKREVMDAMLKSLCDEYKQKFYAAVEALPKGFEFTAEDITEQVGRPPKQNGIGALIASCSKRKLIIFTGQMVPAKREVRNANLLMCWRRI